MRQNWTKRDVDFSRCVEAISEIGDCKLSGLTFPPTVIETPKHNPQPLRQKTQTVAYRDQKVSKTFQPVEDLRTFRTALARFPLVLLTVHGLIRNNNNNNTVG